MAPVLIIPNSLPFGKKIWFIHTIISLHFSDLPAHQSITDAQRQALRRWFKQQYPRPRQRDCIPWFEKQFNHHLSASTVTI